MNQVDHETVPGAETVDSAQARGQARTRVEPSGQREPGEGSPGPGAAAGAPDGGRDTFTLVCAPSPSFPGADVVMWDSEALRAHWAAIVASSDDAIISKTLEGVILSWNGGAERMFGYTAAEIIGKPVTLLIPPEHGDEEPSILARVRNGERIDHYQTVRLRKDGGLIDISLTVSPIRNARGEVIAASKIARDITRQRRAEEQSRAIDKRFRLMADSAPVLIWMSDLTRARTWLNKACLDFTGRRLDQELGFGWTDNVHPDDLARCLETYDSSFEMRAPFRTEYRLQRHDGELRWIMDTAVPLNEGPGGTFSGYIGSCIDITEMRQSQLNREELLRAERAARCETERLSRLKDEFLATLSHELRTPLNAILGWSTLLRRLDPDSPDHPRGLEAIERNARAQAQIIGDLLDMSRIISGKVQLDMQPVDLREVIQAALETVRPSAEAKDLSLRPRLDARAERVRGDPNRLQQILWNLLANAVKFTPPHGEIHILLERVGPQFEITVRDSGVGIRPEFLPYLFDRFRQADASTTRRHGGLGLGLSIVKHLAELHGGTVRASSAGEGQGSAFTVSLPIVGVYADEAACSLRPSLTNAADTFSEDLPNLHGVTALVVDDELDSLVLVNRLIEDRGGRAITASNVSEALRIFAAEPIDIVVSDIGMPDVDGYQLIRRIRALEQHSSRPVMAVALTAYARPADRQRALLSGYQMHLSKPVDPRELLAGIASLLNAGRAEAR